MATTTRQAVIRITELEHSAFCKTEDDLPSKPLAEELAVNVRWQKIPSEYLHCSVDELDGRIEQAKKDLGASVTVLGHHYQREEVIKYADFQGDSFMLSQQAASQQEANYIVFCGVHFMAETACILCAPHQKVILPNLAAGCSMADMAPMEDVDDAWEDLIAALDGFGGITPVTYMNSIASIKALCGRNGGAVCTSSNAAAVLEWAFEKTDRVLFLPDQHLGRNTGLKLGIPTDRMVVWNPFKRLGGNTPDQLRNAKLVLWQGHCAVHTRFTVGQIHAARSGFPTCASWFTRNAPWRRSRRRTWWFHRVHPQSDQRLSAGKHLGRRHRDQPGQPLGPAEPGQDHLLPGPGDLSLLHHVPYPSGLPAVGTGGTAGQHRGKPDNGAPGRKAGCPRCLGAYAGPEVTASGNHRAVYALAVQSQIPQPTGTSNGGLCSLTAGRPPPIDREHQCAYSLGRARAQVSCIMPRPGRGQDRGDVQRTNG